MTDILHRLVRYIAAQLQALPHWDDAYGLCFINAGGQIERYKYIDLPNPKPLIISPSDDKGTYIYIREFDFDVTGREFESRDFGSCEPQGASIRKRLRAVAVSSTLCYPVELASNLSHDILNINLCADGITPYEIESAHVLYRGEKNGLEALFREEVPIEKAKPSRNIIMASFDFDLVFNYAGFCDNQDQPPKLCK